MKKSLLACVLVDSRLLLLEQILDKENVLYCKIKKKILYANNN